MCTCSVVSWNPQRRDESPPRYALSTMRVMLFVFIPQPANRRLALIRNERLPAKHSLSTHKLRHPALSGARDANLFSRSVLCSY